MGDCPSAQVANQIRPVQIRKESQCDVPVFESLKQTSGIDSGLVQAYGLPSWIVWREACL